MPVWTGARPRVLLAGLPAARHGTLESLAALEQLSDVQLVVRAGEGMEPRNLLSHPRVVRDDGMSASGVIAPTWCEAYTAEVARASISGIPVIATTRAAGYSIAVETRVGDVRSLVAAVESVLR